MKPYFCFFILLLLSSCFKDEEVIKVTTINNLPRHIITNSELVINVADENENPLVGLTASFNGNIKVVDKNSFFHFTGNNINKFDETLKITDQNGHDYEYQIQSIANETNYKKINVFTNKTIKEIHSNELQKINVSSDVALNFSKNNYLINTNQSYTGEVQIRYTHYASENKLVETLEKGSSSVNLAYNSQIPTSVFDQNLLDVRIFPNPTTGLLNFDTSHVDLKSISIISGSGKLVHKVLNLSSNSVDLSVLPNGYYTIEFLCSDGMKITKKLIKI